MVEALVRSMLGPHGNQMLDFLLGHPVLVSGVFAVWLGIYAAGRLQLWRLQIEAKALILKEHQALRERQAEVTPKALYKVVAPQWEQFVKERKGFIPHRLELWPVFITPETVQHHIDLSPRGIADILQSYQLDSPEDPPSPDRN